MMASTIGSDGRTRTSAAQAASDLTTPRAETPRKKASQVATSSVRKPPPPTRPSPSARRRLLVGLLVFVVFVAFVVAGLALDEFQAVLANAATICLSCIGIE